jgi:hypothetical protein
MKIQIINVSVGQSAKVFAVLYTVMSLPIFLVMAAFGMLGGAGIALVALVLGPVIYGVLAFLGAGLGAWLYNVVAKFVGGLEYSTKEVSEATATV